MYLFQLMFFTSFTSLQQTSSNILLSNSSDAEELLNKDKDQISTV